MPCTINDLLHAVFVTGCICFMVDGCIVWYHHNGWNNGENSRRLVKMLAQDDVNLPGYGRLSDSAFPVSGAMFGGIVTPQKRVCN